MLKFIGLQNLAAGRAGFFSFPAIYGTIVLIHTYIVEVWRERYERYAPFSLYLSLLLLVLLNKSEAKNQQIIALKSLATIKIIRRRQRATSVAPPYT